MQAALIQPLLEQIKSKTAEFTGISGSVLDFAFALFIVLLFAVIAEVVYHFVYNVLPRVTARTKTKLDDEILKALQGPIRLLVIIIGLSLALHTIAFSYEQFKLIDQFFTVLAIFIGAYFVVKIIEAFSRWYMMEVAPKTLSPIDDQLVPFLNRIFKIFIIAIAVLVALSAIGYEITPLIAGVGIAGVAIALAAQASLTDIFGSLNIMADRPYRVGDRIKFVGREDQKGDVIDIGVRSTRIKLEDDSHSKFHNE
jgi:MscS family membrane protein